MRTALFLALAWSAAAHAQPIIYQPEIDSPIGVRNPNAPPETAQYDFLIGDWTADVAYMQANGKVLDYQAKWHNVWLVDGFVVLQEWRGPYATGAELRVYNPQLGKWTGRNVYAGRAAWTDTTAEFIDGEMVVTTEGNPNAPRPFINREIYHQIADDSFEMFSERSFDGGETWQRGIAGTYEMKMTRLD